MRDRFDLSGQRSGRAPGELHLRIPEGVEPGGAPLPRGIRLRQQLRAVGMWLPALAAFAATIAVAGAAGDGLVRAVCFAVAMLAVSRLLHDFPYPLRLIPASRYALCVLPAFSGAAAVAALSVAEHDAFVAVDVLPGLLAAVAVALTVEVVGSRLVARRPLRIAVLGAADFVPAIRRELDAIGGPREIEVIGWLNLGGSVPLTGHRADEKTLGRVRAAITEHEIDLLVRGPGSGSSRGGRDAYDAIAAGCLDLPVRMIDGNQLYERVFGHVPIGTIDSAWFLFLMHPSFRASSKASKRAIDLVVGVVAGLIALPLVAIGSLAILLTDGRPITYRQRRVGERGKEFEIIKLRTMRPDSEDADQRWSGADDDRVTAVGRILRRLHIDELPQIVNVLKGDMTLVGPRPEQPQITAQLERVFPHYSRRLLVKPGVTGWAQVRCGYAGSELGTAWKLCHDLYYLKHRSTLVDLLIMLETLVIAARDSHRPMRAPQAGFLFSPTPGGRNLAGMDESPLDAGLAGSTGS
ncbi:MAG: sugar transferase [Solirubrobacterales bacterium]|nr:sugar transferase [Solirubrobacterales bacterium]MCB8970304.1 sugar transferase [Thermoleophilales bacterium]MCO5325467.1 sugar transferase [Solirubrobacterales bacterium]